MGKKLDALLGRTFRVSKFKSLLNLAISRLAVLKNQRQVRFSQAVSDVSQLLQLGHHERALLRVEHVIKEQNMLDVFVMTEGFCDLLIERVHVIEQHRECPEELKEAISSLLFAASRIGEFPELQEIRAVLTSRYGKEIAARSIELRNNCGVNSKMVQKLTTRQPGLEIRMKVLKEIADDNNIVLKLEEASTSTEGTSADSDFSKSKLSNEIRPEEVGDDYRLSDSGKTKKKYKDVADAAQAAFESAAYAAAAARAAVELSRSDSHDPDDHDNPSNDQKKRSFDVLELKRSEPEQKQEDKDVSQGEGSGQGDGKAESKRLMSGSSTDSEEISVEVPAMSFREDPVKLLEKDTVIYDSEEETRGTGYVTMTTKVKEKKGLMGGKNWDEIGHGQLHSAKDPEVHREKGPISVRTRQVRGY